MKLGAKAKYLIPGEREVLGLRDYLKIRRETGICETCQHDMPTHPKCQTCGVLCGPGHEYSLSEYRERELCGQCIHAWGVIERVLGRKVGFDYFMLPMSRDFQGVYQLKKEHIRCLA